METSGVIASSVMDGVLSTLTACGIDSKAMSARLGMQGRGASNASGFTPLAAFTTILEVASEEHHDPLIGLTLGKLFDCRNLGVISQLFRSAPTLGDGIERLVRYFPVLQSNTRSTLSLENGQARLAYAITDHTVRHRLQDADFTEVVFCTLIGDSIGGDWRPTCVDFEHSPGGETGVYSSHFGCSLRFDRRENAIIFPDRYLAMPMKARDDRLFARLEHELAGQMRHSEFKLDLVSSIKAWIAASICRSASIDIEDAANDFGMSLRSFQRKLFELGVNYADLKNGVRMEIAETMLASTPLPISAIADHLGYSEPSAFARSFRKLTGETPARCRDRHTN
jgi:AraC-like DNA-binding protein